MVADEATPNRLGDASTDESAVQALLVREFRLGPLRTVAPAAQVAEVAGHLRRVVRVVPR